MMKNPSQSIYPKKIVIYDNNLFDNGENTIFFIFQIAMALQATNIIINYYFYLGRYPIQFNLIKSLIISYLILLLLLWIAKIAIANKEKFSNLSFVSICVGLILAIIPQIFFLINMALYTEYFIGKNHAVFLNNFNSVKTISFLSHILFWSGIVLILSFFCYLERNQQKNGILLLTEIIFSMAMLITPVCLFLNFKLVDGQSFIGSINLANKKMCMLFYSAKIIPPFQIATMIVIFAIFFKIFFLIAQSEINLDKDKLADRTNSQIEGHPSNRPVCLSYNYTVVY